MNGNGKSEKTLQESILLCEAAFLFDPMPNMFTET